MLLPAGCFQVRVLVAPGVTVTLERSAGGVWHGSFVGSERVQYVTGSYSWRKVLRKTSRAAVKAYGR